MFDLLTYYPKLLLLLLLLCVIVARAPSPAEAGADAGPTPRTRYLSRVLGGMAWFFLAYLVWKFPRVIYGFLVLCWRLPSLFAQGWPFPSLSLPVRLRKHWNHQVDKMPLWAATTVSSRPAKEISTFFLDKMGTGGTGRFQDWVAMSLTGLSPTDPSAKRVLERLGNSRAGKTRSTFRTVLNHAARRMGKTPYQILTSYPHAVSDHIMMEIEDMVHGKQIEKSTAATYVSQAQRILTRVPGVPPEHLQQLKEYVAGLNRDGAKIPKRQAPPLTHGQFRALMNSPRVKQDVRLRGSLYVAWKTCSRVDETVNLPLPLDQTDARELLIKWRGSTKTSVMHPFAARFHTTLSWDYTDSTAPDPELLIYLTKGSGTLGHGLKTADIAAAMNEILGTSNLGGHSIKRGSLDYLWSLDQDPVPIESIEMVAKHQSPRAAILGETHLRYLTGSVATAVKRMGTHLATRRL